MEHRSGYPEGPKPGPAEVSTSAIPWGIPLPTWGATTHYSFRPEQAGFWVSNPIAPLTTVCP